MGDKTPNDNKLNNFQNFIQLQKQIIEAIPKDDILNSGTIPLVLGLDELFGFLEEHFSEFYESENLNAVIPFVHRCLKMWANRDYLNSDIGLLLLYFLEQYKDNERDLGVAIQIIYQVLNSIKTFEKKEIQISKKAFLQLTTQLPIITNRNVLSNAIACLQLYVNMFPENRDIMLNLWSDLSKSLAVKTNSLITKDTEIDILIQLFDEFHNINPNIHDEPTIIATIQQLLKSDQRKDRKCGYYLFKKMLQCLAMKFSNISSVWLSAEQCNEIERSWKLYITILENLEENQSHLILPSLSNLHELIKKKQLSLPWLDILYMRILTHNNNLVLRWAIEFFLEKFTSADFLLDTLKLLLETSNSNLFYNYEGYFINMEYFSSFLQGDLINLYTIIGDINWKPIPLCMWLKKLNEKDLPDSICYEQILKISSRVRALQNCKIRKNAIEMCNKLFNDFIEKMSMKEYVKYVETLYNCTDSYEEHDMLYKKKSSLIEKEKDFVFKKKIYEIFRNHSFFNEMYFDLTKFVDFLNEVPVQQHGWFRFLPYHSFRLSNEHNIKLIKLYHLNIDIIKSYNLPEMINEFEKYLLKSSPFDKDELIHCRLSAISFYIKNLTSLNNVDDESLRLIFDSDISETQIYKLCFCLQNTVKILNTWIIDELINRICSNDVLYFIVTYVNNNNDANIRNKYIQTLCEKYLQYLPTILYTVELLKLPDQTRFFYTDVNKGESRIEELFCFHQFDEYESHSYLVKNTWLHAIEKSSYKDYILFLLKCHKDITKKRPRYFENSNEHRFKLRIALGVIKAHLAAKVTSIEIYDEIWDILINENNQLNISYIYEFILGIYDVREDIIVGKLSQAHTLTSSQQVSIISVAYTFSMERNLNNMWKEKIISNLLALTMGANFQTRLFAQMTLLKLLKNTKFNNIPNRDQIIKSVESATGTKLEEYINDIRIHMWDIKNNYENKIYSDSESMQMCDAILYITNVPFDEIISPLFKIDKLECPLLKTQLIKCRETFMKKSKSTTPEEANSYNVLNDQLQRKMNPVNDVTEPNNLFVYPIEEKTTEMLVIASLIDKLPNLGGIARTCEVLGIQNLVMDSKMHTEKNDFKNLSMTAEKSLNIIEVKPKNLKEFLIEKQLQGFKIVGAEQTSNSQNFQNFEFPKKCVLLLGHEKDGIPAPLLGLLDYAVEVPQFGQVRSLNVHVTGALFMWEYCKQHLIQK